MDHQDYKVCVPVSDLDNLWLQYYEQAYIEGVNTEAEDDRHENIGKKYTYHRDWYYQWDKDDERYYVVVD